MFVNLIKNLVTEYSQKQRVNDFRKNDSLQIEEKMNTSPQQEHKSVLKYPIYKITDRYQENRCFNIIIIKDTVKVSAEIAYPHVEQRVKANDAVKKQITQKSAEKTGQKAVSPPAHQPEGYSQDDQQIRLDGTDGDHLTHSRLKNNAYQNQKQHCNLSFHSVSSLKNVLIAAGLAFRFGGL